MELYVVRRILSSRRSILEKQTHYAILNLQYFHKNWQEKPSKCDSKLSQNLENVIPIIETTKTHPYMTLSYQNTK